MKSLVTIGTLVFLSFCLSSCYSSRSLVDDDVYVVKNSLLPTDESLNDETTYSSYRYKKNRNIASDDYYFNDDQIIYIRYYPANYWYSPYNNYCYNHSLYYGNGFYNAFGDVVYDPYSGHYLLNPNYDPYAYNGSSYLPYYYGYQGYNGYGTNAMYCNNYYGYNYYGGYYYPYNYGVSSTNPKHNGPRGSLTGIIDPSRRSNSTSNIKMSSVPNPKIEKRVITDLRSESRLTQELRPASLTVREPMSRQTLNQREPIGLNPTESRPSQHHQNTRFEGRQSGREINHNPSRGGFEQREQSSPTRNPSEGNPQRGGNNPKPAPRRN